MSAPKDGGKWGDLTPRVASAIVMLLIGALAVWAGGFAFGALVAVGVLAMFWELLTMLRAAVAKGAAPLPYGLYALAVFLAGYAFVWLRLGHNGLWVILWLFTVVIVTDVLGYFAGRMIGGRKFWPAISPKKTWSGTIAGWVGAGFSGYFFAHQAEIGTPLVLMLVSVLFSFASQMGDIAESALKRRAGVKDSSALIPGHGGVLDRFDGMVGVGFASCLVFMAQDLLGL